MSINKSSPDLENHPLFGNRKRILATPTQAGVTGKKHDTGKVIVTSVMLVLLAGAALLTGLWASNPTSGFGATVVAWPGQVWQQLLQNQLGNATGSGIAQQSPWVLARVAGVMAYVLSFASVTLGLTMSLRWKWVRNVLHPTATFYLHKILSLLTVFFVVLHLAGLVLDNYIKISLWQVLLPFSTASYRPLWTGLGTIAIYGAVLVIITAYLASKLGYKVWRTVHYLTFGIFYISLLHGVMSGTDTGSWWMEIDLHFVWLASFWLDRPAFWKAPIDDQCVTSYQTGASHWEILSSKLVRHKFSTDGAIFKYCSVFYGTFDLKCFLGHKRSRMPRLPLI